MEKWMNHPDLKNLDPVKLELLKKAHQQTVGKNGKELAPNAFMTKTPKVFDKIIKIPRRYIVKYIKVLQRIVVSTFRKSKIGSWNITEIKETENIEIIMNMRLL